MKILDKIVRICLECGDDITMLFDEYHPEITECQCCIFDTEIIEIQKEKNLQINKGDIDKYNAGAIDEIDHFEDDENGFNLARLLSMRG